FKHRSSESLSLSFSHHFLQHIIKLHILTHTHSHTFSLSLYKLNIKPNQTTQLMQPSTARNSIILAVVSSAVTLIIHALLHGFGDVMLARNGFRGYAPSFQIVFPHVAAAYSILFGIYALRKTRVATHTVVSRDGGFIEGGQQTHRDAAYATGPRFGLARGISIFAVVCWLVATIAFYIHGTPIPLGANCYSRDQYGELVCNTIKGDEILLPATGVFWLIASVLCHMAI
ncbi:hypothetical protein GQ42DRAFT_89929, partial [Ramicandelaber brevisporus]